MSQGRQREGLAFKGIAYPFTPEVPKRRRTPREARMQAQLMARCRALTPYYPDLQWVYAYPAGIFLGTWRDPVTGREYSPGGAKAKAMGLKRGLPDIVIDVPRGGWRKGWLELKMPGKKPTPEQERIHRALRRRGDWVGVAYSLEEAWGMVCNYLGVPAEVWKMGVEMGVIDLGPTWDYYSDSWGGAHDED